MRLYRTLLTMPPTSRDRSRARWSPVEALPSRALPAAAAVAAAAGREACPLCEEESGFPGLGEGCRKGSPIAW